MSAVSFLRIFVRRGALRRFHLLNRDTSEMPVSIEWDRRLSDRRESVEDAPAERRNTDRRQTPPFTWQHADFVVAPPDEKSE